MMRERRGGGKYCGNSGAYDLSDFHLVPSALCGDLILTDKQYLLIDRVKPFYATIGDDCVIFQGKGI